MVLMRNLTTRSRVLLFVTALTAFWIAYNLNPTSVNVVSMQTTNAQSTSGSGAAENPLLAKWAGPYGGVPPFDRVRVADFKPALEAAMAENLAELDRIAKILPRQLSRTPSLQWNASAEHLIASKLFTAFSVRP